MWLVYSVELEKNPILKTTIRTLVDGKVTFPTNTNIRPSIFVFDRDLFFLKKKTCTGLGNGTKSLT
jgi:hypothetical protein